RSVLVGGSSDVPGHGMTETVRDPEGRRLDQVRLLGVRARGHHGVLDSERREGQDFLADVVLHLDTRAAARTDDLARTVSYAEIAEEVAAVLAGPPADLLETLAGRLARVALTPEAVHAVDVVVHKPQAPLSVAFQDVQVHVRRYRADLPTLPTVPPGADPGRVHGRRTDGPPTEVDVGPTEVDVGPTEVDARPDGPVDVVLALGANLGEALATMRSAVADLRAVDGLEVTGVSPLARTAPVLAAGQPPQPDYLNAVVRGRTTLPPREVLAAAHRIEDAHGRRRAERWAPRTLDVDVIAVGDVRSEDPELTLPHPRAHERAFVLLPWARLAPDAVLPGRGPVAELAERAADRATVRRLTTDWLDPGAHPEGA
ncbi:2-amino-4-hydroxy-6-hydroxymethyldihydropteridine diphosphokinase, partial [Georgenia sp. 10Sc9-8]|nr:2-amino-4-hydroxy-6-hydroxymethyldihydropteridine diphosphokinase [Georgenia halotolerans]